MSGAVPDGTFGGGPCAGTVVGTRTSSACSSFRSAGVQSGRRSTRAERRGAPQRSPGTRSARAGQAGGSAIPWPHPTRRRRHRDRRPAGRARRRVPIAEGEQDAASAGRSVAAGRRWGETAAVDPGAAPGVPCVRRVGRLPRRRRHEVVSVPDGEQPTVERADLRRGRRLRNDLSGMARAQRHEPALVAGVRRGDEEHSSSVDRPDRGDRRCVAGRRDLAELRDLHPAPPPGLGRERRGRGHAVAASEVHVLGINLRVGARRPDHDELRSGPGGFRPPERSVERRTGDRRPELPSDVVDRAVVERFAAVAERHSPVDQDPPAAERRLHLARAQWDVDPREAVVELEWRRAHPRVEAAAASGSGDEHQDEDAAGPTHTHSGSLDQEPLWWTAGSVHASEHRHVRVAVLLIDRRATA